MAKHAKRKKKTTTRRRRRVSGLGSGIDLQGIALAGAGAVGVSMLKKYLTKDPTKTTLVNLAPFVGLGAAVLLPMLIKSPTMKAVAIGAGAMGVVNALQKLAPNIVGQIDSVPVISSTMNRYRGALKPSVNGIGYNLPNTSIYKDSMSVVNGIGCTSAVVGRFDGSGSGAANAN